MKNTEESWCSVCKKRTTWVVARLRSRCTGCNTVFPCSVCSHMDCKEARGEAKPDENGILQIVGFFLFFLLQACGGDGDFSAISDADLTSGQRAGAPTVEQMGGGKGGQIGSVVDSGAGGLASTDSRALDAMPDQVPAKPGAVAAFYWPLDEGSGSRSEDATMRGAGLRLGRDVATLWKKGGAPLLFSNQASLDFDGNSFAETSNQASFSSFNSSKTISFWMMPKIQSVLNQIGRNQVLRLSGGDMHEIQMGYRADAFGVYGPDGHYLLVKGPKDPSIGTWHHIAYVVQAANLSLEHVLYIDGVQVGKVTLPSLSEDIKLVDLSLGRTSDRWGEYFTGGVDDVRIYNRALSEAEVASLAGGNR